MLAVGRWMPAARQYVNMSTNQNSWILRNKWILLLAATPVLVGAWWAFRPEKLFINQKVNEPAPFAGNGGGPQPIYTGELEGQAHKTSGRATIYQSQGGKSFLRLSNFVT